MDTMKITSLPFHAARALAITAFAAVALSSTAQAQPKIMRIIVPYAPGGPIDVTARLMARLVARLNALVPDERYHVTSESLLVDGHNYSREASWMCPVSIGGRNAGSE